MSKESLKSKKERALQIFGILTEKYPDVSTFLTHDNPFQLLIAVILSAQCTDERVNKVTPILFERFKTIKDLAYADLEDVKDCIKSVNFFNNKSKNIIETARIIHEEYNDDVPDDLERLVLLPGVGRKTANVVLGQAFNTPGITVDTHVRRVMTRMGFSSQVDPVKVEQDLMKVWDVTMWIDFSTVTILHGRDTCKARQPRCSECVCVDYCLQKF